jgi:predicted HTH transcriptional regulator
LEVSYIIEGTGPRKEMWEIPLTVFKEAIINALSHRDYYEQGAVTMIEVYDDRVEISNPGGLLIGVKKEFGKKSMTRNPLIFGLFTRMSLVEQVASGIPRMREEMLEAGLPEPVFSTNGGFFTVEFKRPDKDTVVYFEGKPISFSDTINEDSDTINERKDTVNEDGDTINERNDTINEDGDTINLDDGIINLDDVIINPDNGIVNLDDDIVNLENGIVNPDNGIINLDDGIVNLENGIVNPDDGIINDTVNEEVSIEEILLRLIAKNEGLSAPQLSTRIGKSLSTAKRYLAKLKKSDKIEFRGAPKTGGYYLKSIHMALPPPPQSG